MKKQIMTLASKVGFKSLLVTRDLVPIKSPMCYFYYLCELQKWLIEKYNIHLWVYYCMILESSFYQIRHEISKNEYHNLTNENNSNKMKEYTYEESLEQGLLEALKLIKV